MGHLKKHDQNIPRGIERNILLKGKSKRAAEIVENDIISKVYPGSQKNLRGMAWCKGWPVEIISTYTHKHNLGEQPCKYFAGYAQKAKV